MRQRTRKNSEEQDDIVSEDAQDIEKNIQLRNQLDTRLSTTPLAHFDLAIDQSHTLLSCQRILLDIIRKNESLYNE